MDDIQSSILVFNTTITNKAPELNSELVPSLPHRASAFKCFSSTKSRREDGIGNDSQSAFKRAIFYFRSLDLSRRKDNNTLASCSNYAYMISERKRRKKLAESFQALRELLPSKVRADKLSVLTQTREYLASLEVEVVKLSQRNQKLEAQLFPINEAAEEVCDSTSTKFLPQTKEGESCCQPKEEDANGLMLHRRLSDNDVFLFPYLPQESGGLYGIQVQQTISSNGSQGTAICSRIYEEEETNSESSLRAAVNSPNNSSIASCSSHFPSKRKRKSEHSFSLDAHHFFDSDEASVALRVKLDKDR